MWQAVATGLVEGVLVVTDESGARVTSGLANSRGIARAVLVQEPDDARTSFGIGLDALDDTGRPGGALTVQQTLYRYRSSVPVSQVATMTMHRTGDLVTLEVTQDGRTSSWDMGVPGRPLLVGVDTRAGGQLSGLASGLARRRRPESASKALGDSVRRGRLLVRRNLYTGAADVYEVVASREVVN